MARVFSYFCIYTQYKYIGKNEGNQTVYARSVAVDFPPGMPHKNPMPLFVARIQSTLLLKTLWAVGVAVVCANNALAALGQPLAKNTTSTAAATRFSAASSTQSGRYTARSSTLESGTVVSEYATPAGLVFAVAWEGPTLPDLSNLLGNYFPTFKEKADASRANRNVGTPLHIDSEGLVMRSSGRMRNFSGYAYAPDLIPAGVNISDILP